MHWNAKSSTASSSRASFRVGSPLTQVTSVIQVMPLLITDGSAIEQPISGKYCICKILTPTIIFKYAYRKRGAE